MLHQWVRKTLGLATAGIMILSIGACSNNQPPAASSAPPVTESAAASEPAPAESAPAETQAADVLKELPRNETLYFGGQQWGTVNNVNPFSASSNNAMAITNASASARIIVFETLYMYNLLDGSVHPLLAEGDPTWNAEHTELTVKINPAAKWWDGSPVTAEDVAYAWTAHNTHNTPTALQFGEYIESITAADAQTVLFKAKTGAEGKAVNPLMLEDYVVKQYITQKAWTQTLEARSSSDDAFMNDPADDVISSGPYKPYYDDDQKVVFIRDDSYWGVALWGSLPAPKYIAHTIYADNAATQVAFENNEIDVDQQFLADVQKLWLEKNLPISTYLDQPPYGICVTMPTAWFNMKKPGLDQVAVRKAIAIAVDYDQINQNAMTGQSPTFTDVPRSLMNPTGGEQAMYDKAAVSDLQWGGKDIEGAKKLLDDAGIVDGDGDGIREFNGQNLKYNAACPNGWTDWQASMEIVAAAGKEIGIEITTLFPEWDVYQTVFTDGAQTEYDIFMWGGDGTGPTYPWARVRQRLSSEYVGTKNNWNGNYGGYTNARADEIIKAIPGESDPAILKNYYTEAVKIYLEEVPSFALMYRPELFYGVNETVWTGFPASDDGRNIPPTVCTDGYGIAGLYGLKLVN